MPNTYPTVLERAFTLARAGDCRTVTEIQKTLIREGYASVAAQLSSQSLRSDLRRTIRAG